MTAKAPRARKTTLDAADQRDADLVAQHLAGDEKATLALLKQWQPLLNRMARQYADYAQKHSSVACFEDMQSEATLGLFIATKSFKPVLTDGTPNPWGPFLKLVLSRHLATVSWRDGSAVKVGRAQQEARMKEHYGHDCGRTARPPIMVPSVALDAPAGEDGATVLETMAEEKARDANPAVEALRFAAWTDPLLAEAIDRIRNGKPLRKGMKEHLVATYPDIGALAQSWCG